MMTKDLILFIDSGDTLVDESTEIRDDNGVVIEAQLFPGAGEALQSLYRAGYRIALVADGLEASFRNIFRQHDLEYCFEARAISESVGAEKPDPAMFRCAMEQMGLTEEDRGHIVMIGNNLERDIRGANAMGIHSILAEYSPRYRMSPTCPEEEPERVAEEPSRIPELVELLNGALGDADAQNRNVRRLWERDCLAK